MKTLLRFIPLLAFVLLCAADLLAKPVVNDKLIAAVTAADDERLAATKAGDRARLDAIFSDELHYAHSSGKLDTKASYMNALVSHRMVLRKLRLQ